MQKQFNMQQKKKVMTNDFLEKLQKRWKNEMVKDLEKFREETHFKETCGGRNR